MSFCKNCGYMFLSESDNMCGNCGTPRGQGNSYCPNCGATSYPDQNNCTMCGYFIGKSGNVGNQQATQSNNNPGANSSNTATYNSIPFPQDSAFNQNAFNTHTGYPVLQQTPIYGGSKSKLAAGLLGVFLGGFGLHNFYLGYTSRGITQLVLSIFGILTSCIFIGVPICFGVGVWGFVEGLMILTGRISYDANGTPLRDD